MRDRTDALEGLAGHLRQKRLIAFVGAGLSAAGGYPTWTQLLDHFQDTLLNLPSPPESPKYILQLGRMKDDLWRAEEYRRLLGKAGFHSVLWDQFRPRTGDPIPEALTELVQLPFRHFLTTNYDPSLEIALGNKRPPLSIIDWLDNPKLSAFLSCLSRPDGDAHLVYIHGRYADPVNIVLTESDYVKRYVLNDDADRKLFAILITQPVLFVGFSLADPELTYIMRNVQARVSDGPARHYAILPSPSTNEHEVAAYKGYYARKFGVEAVFYRPTQDHSNLAVILRELRDRVDHPAASRLRSIRQASRTETHASRHDPDDPNKGRFGGKAARNGWTLRATVAETEASGWFEVALVVTAPARRSTNAKKVKFHLHPTFTPDYAWVTIKDSEARLERISYGAYTVGVEIQGERTKLELDLSELPGIPEAFRRN